jgi:hypothetical protein
MPEFHENWYEISSETVPGKREFRERFLLQDKSNIFDCAFNIPRNILIKFDIGD